MFEDSLAFPFLGTTVYAYGALLMLGCWLAFGTLAYVTRGLPKARLAAAWTAALSLPFGFVLARLMFGLLDPGFTPVLTLKNLLDVKAGGFAMYGAFLGAALAVFLGARLAKASLPQAFDHLAAALPAFLIPARLGECFTALGISRPLTTPFLINSFLARRDEYDAYLRTYLLEALAAAVLLVVVLRLLRRQGKPGRAFAAFCLLYGISQTLMESLRYDGHLRYSFIGVQQVLSAALFGVTIICLAIKRLRRGGKSRPAILALVSLPLVLGAIIGVEFLVDRSQLGKLFSYGLYLLVLALPTALGMALLKEEQLGQGTR